MGMTSDIPGLEDMDETEQSLKKLVVQMTSARDKSSSTKRLGYQHVRAFVRRQ
jgi:hypothetical protein